MSTRYMANTRIDAALAPLREAEQQRRKSQKQADEKIAAAIKELSDPSQLSAFYSKGEEKTFHEERSRGASELTRIFGNRLATLDLVLR